MSDSEKDLFGESEDQPIELDSPQIETEHATVHQKASLKRFAPSHDVKNVWISRLPGFLSIEPQPFDAERFANLAKSPEQIALETNTVRWTYAASENQEEQKVTRVSNARIVQWSDGSKTLQLGDDHFEIKTHEQSDPTFVVTQNEDEPLLATRYLVNQSMTFIPTSTTSGAHALLAKALAQKQENGQIRVGSVDTTEDPDKVQREIERAEQIKEKARRRLAAERDEVISYTDRTMEMQAMDVDQEEEEGDVENEEDGEKDAEESEDEDMEREEVDKDSGESDDERLERLNRIKYQKEPLRTKVLDDEESD